MRNKFPATKAPLYTLVTRHTYYAPSFIPIVQYLPSVCPPMRTEANAKCQEDLQVLLPWRLDLLHQEHRTPTPENYPKEKDY